MAALLRRCTRFAVLLVAASACHKPPPGGNPRPANDSTYAAFRPAGDVLQRVVLIGDAGKSTDGNAVMTALRQVAGQHRNTTVVFLGDSGIPAWRDRVPAFCRDSIPPGSTPVQAAAFANAQARARFEAQMRALAGTGAIAYFVPGNHDWYGDTIPGGTGADAVLREDSLVRHWREATGANVFIAPDSTCPGPDFVDLPRVRLIFLDTQRLLRIFEDDGRKQPRLQRPHACRAWHPNEVQAELRRLTRGARERGLEVMVASHHPPLTYGTHCPPFAGLTLHRAIRLVDDDDRFGPNQDVRSGQYDAMRRFMAETFQTDPPLIYVGGHSHGLERIRTAEIDLGQARECALAARAAANVLVSGAGSASNVIHRGPGLQDDLLNYPGFMVLDISPAEFRVRIVRPAAVLAYPQPTQAKQDAEGYVITR
jgi:hypothetical protein